MVSTTAFVVLKLAGAAYLLYSHGNCYVRQLCRLIGAVSITDLTPVIFAWHSDERFQPQSAIFFLAFLPQFARPALGRCTATADSGPEFYRGSVRDIYLYCPDCRKLALWLRLPTGPDFMNGLQPLYSLGWRCAGAQFTLIT